MNIKINRVKIVVTIPKENIDEVRDAMCQKGAGIIGNYTDCSMITKCIGTSRPNEKANPYIGTTNKLELIEEDKLEVVCEINKVKEVIKALRNIHPYEEPAIDIIPLIDEDYFE